MGLMLARRIGQEVQIGDDVTVKIAHVDGKQVKLFITAPRGVPIMRDDAKKREPTLKMKRQLAEAAERSAGLMGGES